MYLNISFISILFSVKSRTELIKVLSLGYKYLRLAIVQSTSQSIKINLYFFIFMPTLRSRSNVAFWRVLQQTGLHRPIDLQLACEYRHDLYCAYKDASAD